MVRLLTENGMGKELWFIIMTECTKGIGSVTISKALDFNRFQMEAYIKEIMWMASLKELESIVGQMENFMKVSGSMD